MIAKRFPCIWGKANPGWAILLVIAFVEMMYCFNYHEDRWDSVIRNCKLSPEHAGEGLVIQWNGLGYYAWLRSLLIDGDWDFDNEFDEHNPHHYYVPPPQYRTPIDRRANQWSVGPACFWAVTVVPGHLFLESFGAYLGPWAPDGYSLPYQLLLGATSLFSSFLGLGFIYGICRTEARPIRAAWATALLTLGTTIFYYNAIEVSLPHGVGTTALAACVWYWLKTHGSIHLRRWFLVGFLVGAASLVRWQLATYAILPAAELLLGRHYSFRGSLLRASLAFVGGFFSFLPQMIAWRCVYGAYLLSPVQGVQYHWLHPSLWTILCSEDRSLFYWTPLTLVACLGTAGLLFRGKVCHKASGKLSPSATGEPIRILAVAFLLQVYVLASMWGQGPLLASTGNFGGVFLARSYGLRDLTESLVLLAPGLAWLLETAPTRRYRMLAGFGFLLAVWNLMLVSLYATNSIPQVTGADPEQLFWKTWESIRNSPSCLLEALTAPLLIAAASLLAPEDSLERSEK